MKHFYLLFSIALLFMACSKDDFDPTKPKNGQVVELFVDHYRTGSDFRVSLNKDRNEKLYTHVDHFDGRELGYTYVIQAKVVVAPRDLMDAPSYWFDYIKTVRKDKYQGQDTIALPLFEFIAPTEAFLLRKGGDKYYYSGYPLSPVDDAVKTKLEEALLKGQELLTAAGPVKQMTIYVKHDEGNYGKGYMVYRVEL